MMLAQYERRKEVALAKALLTLFMSVCGLLWVTQLLAQATAEIVVLHAEPIQTAADEPLRLRVYGLLDDGLAYRPPAEIDSLAFEPAANIEAIQVVSHTQPAPATEPFYVTLLLDTSGSMQANLATTIELAQALVTRAPDNAYFTVISFNGQVDEYLAFTSDKEALVNALGAVRSEDGSTCVNDMTYTAVQSLAQLPQTPRRAIVLFSDGLDEVMRGRDAQCSSRNYDDARRLAQNQVVPIPIHTLHFPHLEEGCIAPLESENNVQTGFTVACEATIAAAAATLDRILTSFTQQWTAEVSLYTPAGDYTLTMTAVLADETTLSTTVVYSAGRNHFPPPLYANPDTVTINEIRYDERVGQLGIDITLCADTIDTEPPCNPAAISALIVRIEDQHTNLKAQEIVVPQFEKSNQWQRLNIPITLIPEHHYLVRVTAENSITDRNLFPLAEDGFSYTPQLEVAVKSAQLIGWGLRPSLTIQPVITRTGAGIEPWRQPDRIIVGGYLIGETPNALYMLPRREITNGHAVVYPVPAGWDNYRLALLVQDPNDAVRGRTQPTPVANTTWPGRIMTNGRTLLAHPYLTLAGLFLFLFLLVLVYVAVRLWLKQRPAETTRVEEEERPVVDGRLRLKIIDALDEKWRDESLVVESYPYTLGRYRCNVNFDEDETIAGRHAAITRQNGTYFIENCDHEYSTYIDDNEIISKQPVPFRPGQHKIRLGQRTRLAFNVEGNDGNGTYHQD